VGAAPIPMLEDWRSGVAGICFLSFLLIAGIALFPKQVGSCHPRRN
jgi:hypothetical protein